MKVALIQNHPRFGEKEYNISRLFAQIDRADAELIILPELCYTGYQFTSQAEVASLSDEADSGVIAHFAAKAKEKDAALVFGFPEKAPEGCYNSALMVTPKGQKFLYRKTHLFYKEKIFFSPGDTGFNVFEFRGVQIGIAICFDWIFPESFRTLALRGADIIAHPSNLVLPYCQQTNYARAIENRVYVCTANRVGAEQREGESLTFTGESVIVSPRGEYLLRAGKDTEEVLVTDIDTTLSRNKNLNAYNNIFSDRRVEFYQHNHS